MSFNFVPKYVVHILCLSSIAGNKVHWLNIIVEVDDIYSNTYMT